MSKNNKLVSIIIPTYYRDDRLERAIRSAIAQDYGKTEVIVVDDSGESYAEPLVNKYDVQYVAHKENQGGNPARNTGYRHCSGDYIQFLDDDDEIFESKISTQVELLDNSPCAEVAHAGVTGREGQIIRPESEQCERSLEKALKFVWPTTITSSLLIADSVFAEVFPLTNRSAADDIGMKIELAQRTEFTHVNKMLTKIGATPDSRSSKKSFVTELQNIYEEYSYLYDEFPDYVRKSALSNIYEAKARRLLSENLWSSKAIYTYYMSINHAPNPDAIQYGGFVASWFGRPGTIVASRLYDSLCKRVS